MKMKKARALYRDAFSHQEERAEHDKRGRIVRRYNVRVYRSDAPGLRSWARRKWANETPRALSPKLLQILASG